MVEVEKIIVNKKTSMDEDRNIVVDSTAEEVFQPQHFDELIGQKKTALQERANSITFCKRQITFADSIEEGEELEHFRKMLEAATALNNVDSNRKTLKVLEQDYANLEREVLEYDNFLKSKGKTKAVDL